ncbi:MAG TPA: hypothetical protein VLI67_09715 [Vicinamibacteria bacterium]|nr:hypothetical protein [Vicinamibacteria bacterium]
MGGSAPAMAAQIADGFILVSPASLKGFGPGELASLKAELEKLQRDARAQVPAQDDALASQARNRRIARLNSAVQTLQHKMTARR